MSHLCSIYILKESLYCIYLIFIFLSSNGHVSQLCGYSLALSLQMQRPHSVHVEPSEQPLGLPAFWVIIFPLAFPSLLLEFVSKIISKELRVFLTHFPVHVTQALKVYEREVDGPESGVDVRQL